MSNLVFAHKKGVWSIWSLILGITATFFREKYISSDRQDVILHPSKNLSEIYFFYECIEQLKPVGASN
jgi:hypothetical protein